MTWFSSGLSNLKEQFNSLINDDDNIGDNLITHTDSLSLDVDNKGVATSPNFRHCVESNQQDEILRQTHRHQVVKYSKTLSHLVNDVNFLHSSLNDVVGNVVRYIDENELLQCKVVDDCQQKVSASLPTDAITAKCLASSQEVEIVEKVDCQETFQNSSLDCQENKKICDKWTTNKETQTIEMVAEPIAGDNCQQQSPVDDHAQLAAKDNKIPEFTQQIENLLIETDEISEKLNCVGKSWQKKNNDGGACVTIPTDQFIEYTSLTSRRDALWEKLKVSFLWPTVAKFKNTEISELSVPDSIKEVFQPGYVERSVIQTSESDATQETPSQQLMPSPALVEQSQDKGDVISASHHHVRTLENDHSTTTSVQKGEKVMDEPVNTSAAVVEVERLRKHLITVEQAYTNELLQCEEEIQILRNELKNKEEKLNSITESYTLMNLSTNKTIEQLQSEIKLLADEKLQLATQLGRCQNDLEKCLFDSHNLRSALDLFYKNKDSEIVQVTEKQNSRIKMLQIDNERLRETLASLRNDVDGSEQITKQNEILREELKTKLDEIDTLKKKVDQLLEQQQHFESTHNKGEGDFRMPATTTGTLDVEGKMRLYITSNSSTTRSQSLRILADVLEFSDYEKIKIGLTGKEEMGRRTAAMAENNQSLIDEFIRFVEKESHPRTKLAETRQQIVKPTSVTGSTDLSPVNDDMITKTTTAMEKTNTSINLPAHSITSSSSILLKDVLNSNDI